MMFVLTARKNAMYGTLVHIAPHEDTAVQNGGYAKS